MVETFFDFPLIGKCVLNMDGKDKGAFLIRQFNNYYVGKGKENDFTKRLEIYNSSIVESFRVYVENPFFLSRKFFVCDNIIYSMGMKFDVQRDRILIEREERNSAIYVMKYIYHKIMEMTESGKYRNCSANFTLNYLMPLLSLYASCYGFFCVHGSCVRVNGKNILLTGLDGVGKSTLATLLCECGGEILADNIVLFDGNKVLNFNLAMRIDLELRSKYRELYRANDFKEVLPDRIDYGIVGIDAIYNLVKIKGGKKIETREYLGDALSWIMFMNAAGEIKEANEVMAPWRYFYNLVRCKEERGMQVVINNFYIPEGGLLAAREELLKWV